jgi:hypothetical protein
MKRVMRILMVAVLACSGWAGFFLEVNEEDSARADLYFDGLFGTVFVVSQGGPIDMYPRPPIGIDPPWVPEPWDSLYLVEVGVDDPIPQPHSGLVAYFTTAHDNVTVALLDADDLSVLGSVLIPEPASLLLLSLGGLLIRSRKGRG